METAGKWVAPNPGSARRYAPLSLVVRPAPVAVEPHHLAEVELADARLDLLQVADHDPDDFRRADEEARRVGQGLLVERPDVASRTWRSSRRDSRSSRCPPQRARARRASRSGPGRPSVAFRMTLWNSSPVTGRSPATPRSSFTTSSIGFLGLVGLHRGDDEEGTRPARVRHRRLGAVAPVLVEAEVAVQPRRRHAAEVAQHGLASRDPAAARPSR